MAKIFGIGLSKTGTTSLAEALNILGYKTKDFPSLSYFPHFLFGIKKVELKNYDAFTDAPVIPFYKTLDKKYPGSKFILTVRDRESWLNSCNRYPRFNYPIHKLPFKIIKLRNEIYGTPRFDPEKFAKAYDDHLNDVYSYFKERDDDLLVMNITRGEDWKNLCPFLEKPIPKIAFPFKNSRKLKYDGQFD